MGLWNYGPDHRWFAWHPVSTRTGWTWLRNVTRRRVYLGSSMPGAAEWWEHIDRRRETETLSKHLGT